MDFLIDVLKVLGIIAALIALRFIIQAVMKNRKAGELMKVILPFLIPPLITGGPMFIAIPAFRNRLPG